MCNVSSLTSPAIKSKRRLSKSCAPPPPPPASPSFPSPISACQGAAVTRLRDVLDHFTASGLSPDSKWSICRLIVFLRRSDLSSHNWNAASKLSFLVIRPITVQPQMQSDHLGDGLSWGWKAPETLIGPHLSCL